MSVGNSHRILGVALATSLSTLCGLRVAQTQPVQPTQPSAVSNLAGQQRATAETTTDATTENISPIQRFKDFLSHPPVIESLVFSERLPPDPKTPWRTDIPLSASHAFRYWHARWQPGAYFLREIKSPDAMSDLQTPGLLAVQFENQCWFHFGRGWGDDFIDYGESASNHVCEVASANSEVLWQVMALGLMHSKAGSIEWSGDQFRVRAPTRAYRITGGLQPSPTGMTDSLRVTYSDAKGAIHWIIRYGYEANRLATGLPSVIRCYWLDSSKEIQRDEFVIRTLRIRASPLALADFSLDPLLATNGWQMHLFTNNAIFAVLPGGQLKKLEDVVAQTPTGRGRAGRVTAGRLALVYLAGRA